MTLKPKIQKESTWKIDEMGKTNFNPDEVIQKSWENEQEKSKAETSCNQPPEIEFPVAWVVIESVNFAEFNGF